MSSVQSRTLNLTYDNILTYCTGDSNITFRDSVYGVATMLSGYGANWAYATLNDAAKAILFPNGTAHPAKLDFNSQIGHGFNLLSHTAYASFFYNNVELASGSYKGVAGQSVYSTTGNANSAVTTSVKSSPIQIRLKTSTDHDWARVSESATSTYLTLYFTRYDFSAVAGAGVTSASVSSSTGYDGDSITFTATPAFGYRFDHWSDGSTDNPHTITVSGADKTLTAFGTSIGKNLSVLNGNSLIVNETVSGNVTVSIGSTLGSLPFTLSDGAKTLLSKGRRMSNNVTVGARTLLCKEKIASYHIPILLCSGSWATNTALNDRTSGTSTASGWITTPFLKVPDGCTNITIECGGTHSGYSCLHEFDTNGGYLSYWGASANPRTFTFDYPSSIAYVRATFNMENLANCYINDNTHNVYIFRGGNV